MKLLHFGVAWLGLFTADALMAQYGPPPVHDFGGAKPLNQDEWVTPSDYPSASIARNEMGEVKVEYAILATGRVDACKVVRSSGYATLDQVPCHLLKRRARFIPAKNAAGKPVATTASSEMRFWFSE